MICDGLENNDDIHSVFAQRFKELRVANQLSMSKTTKILGLKSKGSISGFESGHYPSVETLIKISNLFSVSLDYLLGCKENDRIEQFKEITNDKHKSEIAIYKKEIEFYKKQIKLISKAVDLCKVKKDFEN